MITKSVKDTFRVWFDESGEPVAILIENGHDTLYTLKKATKTDKDQLFESQNKLADYNKEIEDL